ncbi:hypothetical protein [Nonomuraea sediminis]|uniref:hypothetical protein n=1 Tax=Nonomuraea sediminis TaxID=2835864 RepID=UPI001BDD6B15|nr:hypothetical protein [Nonomuraea sediminis]
MPSNKTYGSRPNPAPSRSKIDQTDNQLKQGSPTFDPEICQQGHAVKYGISRMKHHRHATTSERHRDTTTRHTSL